MAISQGIYNFYNKAVRKLKLNDLLTTDVKVCLLDAGYLVNEVNHEFYSDLTNELPTANGYTSGGITVTNKALTETLPGKSAFISDNIVVTATGTLTAKMFVLYFDNAAKDLIGYGYLNWNSGTPAVS